MTSALLGILGIRKILCYIALHSNPTALKQSKAKGHTSYQYLFGPIETQFDLHSQGLNLNCHHQSKPKSIVKCQMSIDLIVCFLSSNLN